MFTTAPYNGKIPSGTWPIVPLKNDGKLCANPKWHAVTGNNGRSSLKSKMAAAQNEEFKMAANQFQIGYVWYNNAELEVRSGCLNTLLAHEYRETA